ncbi:MAG: hypothetical protein P9M00_00040 [Candidatus Tritonobacter lacicola]|nr:hypothetical protein [Candidatus Tritonobacter lacicola]
MKIDLTKTVFAPKETGFIVELLQLASKKGYVTPKSENSPYLLASFGGVEGKGISPKWNVKIYTYNKKKKGHSLVCIDKHVLGKLLEEDYDSFIPPDLQILRIDDAGWGFPLCGVMVGVSDEQNVQTGIVPVEYFRDDTENHFQTRRYLKEYANLAIQLLGNFGASPDTHRIEICTGYVNQPLREELRNLGYDVRVVEVKGLLQDKLEEIYREYILAEIGSDIYYDPKDMKKSEIPRRYRETLELGRKRCPHKIKTGWNAASR